MIWLTQAEKEEDDYSISALEAQTHLGRLYFGKCSILLGEREIDHFEHKGVDLL